MQTYLLPTSLRHALITGTGFIQIGHNGVTAQAEAVPPWEVFCDQWDGLYGKPNVLMRERYVGKSTLQRMYPAFSDQIRQSGGAGVQPDHSELYGPISMWAQIRVPDNDMSRLVKLIEVWKVSSEPGASDGRYCACIEGCTLENGSLS